MSLLIGVDEDMIYDLFAADIKDLSYRWLVLEDGYDIR